MAFGDAPYISLKGVWLLSACVRLLWTNSAFLRAWLHEEGLLIQKTEIWSCTSLLTRSVPPLACGWNEVVSFDWIPRSLQSSCQNSESKWGPLSDMMFSGSPKRE